MVWFDWRGTGQSARQLPASIDDLLLDIDAVMEVIDADVVDVLAPQMACFVACTYAVLRGTKWRSLVLTDPALRFDESPQGMTFRPGYEADFEGFLASHTRQFLPPMATEEAERIARSWAETMPVDTFRAFKSFERKIDLTGTLGSLDIPALILKVAPRSRADSVAALIPNCILLERRHGYYSRRLREEWDEHIGSQFADPPQAAVADPGLSGRELEILGHLAAGQSNPEIATGLCLSVRTVERHARNIYTKLNVHNRTQAANWAREHGVI
jgi:DNA-binding CsgD family transcriptional regulator